jgi:predicted GIY-YIG superfamily endonuclease
MRATQVGRSDVEGSFCLHHGEQTQRDSLIGVTNDLERRVYEHKQNLVPGFSRKYGVTMLVHFEEFGDIHDAIHRKAASRNTGANGR